MPYTPKEDIEPSTTTDTTTSTIIIKCTTNTTFEQIHIFKFTICNGDNKFQKKNNNKTSIILWSDDNKEYV